MRILLLGKNGQVGWELQRSLAPLGELIALDRHGKGAPTSAELIADVTALAIRQVLQDPQLSGVYHLAASGEASWHEYASFAKANGEPLAVKAIKPILARDFPTSARRPLSSRLHTQKLRENFFLTLAGLAKWCNPNA